MGSEFEKTVDVFGVVERVVDEKLEFGNDAQLMSDAFSQFETQSGSVGGREKTGRNAAGNAAFDSQPKAAEFLAGGDCAGVAVDVAV